MRVLATIYPILDRSVRQLIQEHLDQHSQLSLTEVEEIAVRHLKRKGLFRRSLEVGLFLEKILVPSWMHVRVEHQLNSKELCYLQGVLKNRHMPLPWEEVKMALEDYSSSKFDLNLSLTNRGSDMAEIVRVSAYGVRRQESQNRSRVVAAA